MTSQEMHWYRTWVESPSDLGKLVIAIPNLEIVMSNLVSCTLLESPLEHVVGSPLTRWGISTSTIETFLHAATERTSHPPRLQQLIHGNGRLTLCQMGWQVSTHPPTHFLGLVLVALPPAYHEYLAQDPFDRLFQAVAECTYDWESWLDPDGQLIWINPAVERLTGYSVDECFAWHEYPFDILAPEDRSLFREILKGAKQGSSGNDVAFRIVTKQGGYKWFAVSWQPLRCQPGNPIGIRMSKRDISDRKEMEEALRSQTQHLEELASARAHTIIELEQRKLHMQKLADLGQMAACIAHEINNPLAGIKNALRLILGREDLRPSNQQLLNLVDKEMTRITALLHQMYQLGQPTLSPSAPLDVINLLEEVMALVEPQFAPQQIAIRLLDGPENLIGEIRESELKQILHNLLLNACEASHAAGVVEVRISIEPSWMRLDIVDHGEGIPEAIKPHLFEPFVTARPSAKHKGLGLGLSIANSLTEALGGTLQVDSTVGVGTTFSLRLPWKSSHQPVPSPS